MAAPKINNSDILSQVRAQVAERLEKYLEKHAVPAGAPPARDLTDEEVKILKDKFVSGTETLKNHPWNNPDVVNEYWKPIKKTGS